MITLMMIKIEKIENMTTNEKTKNTVTLVMEKKV